MGSTDLSLLSAADVLESMEEAFYAVDRDWRFLYVNRGAEAFWSRSRSDLLGKSMLEAFPSFPGSGPHQAHVAAMANHQRTRVETVSTVTGTPVELNFQPADWGLAVYFRDITDRLQLERELRERAAILALAEESAGIGVWELDLSTLQVRGTKQFFAIHGLSPSEGFVPYEALHALRHPEDQKARAGGLEEALRGQAELYESEYRVRRPDGETRWIFGRGRILRRADGQAFRYSGVDIDVTDRRRGEEIAQRLASIIESSDDAIIGLNLDGTVSSWNDGARRLYGYERDEIVGRPIATLMPSGFASDEALILDRVARGERVEHFETRRRRKDGTEVDISLTVSPIRDSSGSIVGASKIARDISHRKEAENRRILLLREMNHRVKNAFALTSAIVSSARRETSDVSILVENVRNRIAALAQAHQLTLIDPSAEPEEATRATTFTRMAEAIVGPFFSDAERWRLVMEGPEMVIGTSSVASIALILHELATNSAKHGAVGTSGAQLKLRWEINGETVKIVWEELKIETPSRALRTEGFGTLMLRAAASQVGGNIDWLWHDEGVHIEITAQTDFISPPSAA